MSRAATFSLGNWVLKVLGGLELTTDLRSTRGWNIMLPNVELPACFMHFQGPSKWALPTVCNLIGAKVNGSKVYLFHKKER